MCAFAISGPAAFGAADTFLTGDGHDGAYVAPAGTTNLSSVAPISGAVSAGATSLTAGTVRAGAVTFVANRLVLVLQSTGYAGATTSGSQTAIDLTTDAVGTWELARVSSVAGSTINFSAPLVNGYAAGSSQIVAVPEYTTVTVAATRNLSALAWDGTSGGVVAFLANGAVSVSGSVTSAGLGFRGGQRWNTSATGCTELDGGDNNRKGEGIVPLYYGTTTTNHRGRGNRAHGAGGGNCAEGGGAGGGLGGTGGAGGNTSANAAFGGIGGAPLTFSAYDRFAFGGGGGSGDGNTTGNSNGAAGGGITFMRGASLAGTGTISAAGATAGNSTSANEAAGGGGAGGIVYARFTGSVAGPAITVAGGNGGSLSATGNSGPGGGGAGGKALVQGSSVSITPSVTNGIAGVAGTNGNRGATPAAANNPSSSGATTNPGTALAAPTASITTPAAAATTNATPTISGTATAGAAVKVYVDGSLVTTVTADISGNWSYVSAALASGAHNTYVIPVYLGLTGAQSASRSFTVDATAPAAPSITSPANGASTNDNTPTISGTAEANSTVTVYVDGVSAGTTTADGSGNWSFTPGSSLADGSRSLTARATDAVGNVGSLSTAVSITVDTVVPNTTIDSNPASLTNSSSAAFTFSSSEGSSTFQCRLDAGAYASCTSPRNLSSLSDGSHTFYVYATDAAGNADATPATYTWTVDTAVPNTTLDSAPAGDSNSSSATFAFSSNEGAATFECSLDGGAYVPCASPLTYTGLADGAHSFAVRAVDAAGNTDASPVTYNWNIDTAVPTTSLDTAPPANSNSATAAFTFSSNEGAATFECSVDGGAYAPCTSPTNLSGLADGGHTFAVRAVDGAGNTDASPASHSWTVDTAAPTTTIDSSPDPVTNSTAPSFSFSSNEGSATFECRVDGGAWFVCVSPNGDTGVDEGTYTFEVRATDAAGNTDATPASFTWTIDTTAPTTTLDVVPAGDSNSSSATFEFSSNEAGATFECSVDGGAYAPCASPLNLTGLADGGHTFAVRAIDPAGNTDATPVTYNWNVDTAAPTTAIDTAPPADSDSSGAGFTFSSNEGAATFECSIDGGAYTTCTSPQTYTGLADGSHSFSVRATDAAGNTDATPASHTWNIDTVDPTTTLDAVPPGDSDSSSADFEFSSNEAGATFECSVDGGAYAPCASPLNLTGLADGSHTFAVRAVDAAGNTDATPVSYGWNVDTAAPATSITATPPVATTATTADFSFTSNEAGATFECRLDGGAWSLCTSPQNYSSLTDGSHTFDVRATDIAGNTDATPATYTWTVDTAAPETTIDSSPDSVTNSTAPSFSFGSNEAGVTFECRVNGGAWAACVSPDGDTGVDEGTYTFEVRATDAAGNTDATPASFTWTIDTTAPTTDVTAQPPAISSSDAATFEFSSNEPGATFECSVDGGAYAPCSSPLNLTGLADGSHTVQIRATDPAGNTDATPYSYTFTVDTTSPDTTLDAAPAANTDSTGATFEFSSTAGGATFECSLDGAAFTTCSSPQTYTGLAEGSHSFAVRSIDSASNVDPSPATHSWNIDTSDPGTALDAVPPGNSSSSSADFEFSSNEGAATFECSVDGGAFAACASPLNLTGLADGSHEFAVRAVDAAGNTDATPATYDWNIDTAVPTTSLTATPPADANISDATFEFTSNEAAAIFECSLDGSAYVTCSSPVDLTGLTDGSHTFAVRAVDAAGNTDATPASYSWNVDTAAPTTSLTATPPADSNSTSADFEFSSNEAATFECSVDGGAFAACASPHNLTGLTDGSHTFAVRAVDAAGNTDATPATYSWNVDTAAPATSVTLAPPNPSDSGDADFEFTSDEPGSTFECKLDGGAWIACTSPTTFGGLVDGSHTVEIRAIDPAGNVDPTPHSHTWTVDTTAPAAPAITAPADESLTGDNTPAISGTAEANSTVTVLVDGSPVGTATADGGGNWSFTPSSPLADGQRAITATASDAAGNASAASNVVDLTIDTAAPATDVTSEPDAVTSATSGDFEFDSDEPGSSFECSLDGAAYAPCTSPATFGPLGEGPHTVLIRAIDPAGNVEPTPYSYTWTVDSTAPAAPSVTSPAASSITNDSTPAVSGTAEANSTVTVYIDGSPVGTATANGSGNWNFTPASALADGPHTVAATATDAAGNVSALSTVVDFTVDTTDPDASVIQQPGTGGGSASPTFEFSSTDSPVTYSCSVDGSSFAACSSPFTPPTLPPGTHTFTVRVTDAAGNTTDRSISFTVAGESKADDPQCPNGSVTEGTPANIQVLGVRIQRKKLRFDVSSDQFIIARISVKKGKKQIGSSARAVKAGRRSIFLRVKKFPKRNALLTVKLDALTESGGHSVASSNLNVDGVGKLSLSSLTGKSGDQIVSSPCGPAGGAPKMKVKVAAKTKIAGSKTVKVQQTASQWAVSTVTIVQNGKLIARRVFVLQPGKKLMKPVKLLRGNKLAKGKFTVTANTFSIDGVKVVKKQTLKAK